MKSMKKRNPLLKKSLSPPKMFTLFYNLFINFPVITTNVETGQTGLNLAKIKKKVSLCIFLELEGDPVLMIQQPTVSINNYISAAVRDMLIPNAYFKFPIYFVQMYTINLTIIRVV